MATVTKRSTSGTARGAVANAIIDCDVHHRLRDESHIEKYLPPRWRDYHQRYGSRRFTEPAFYVSGPRRNAARTDAFPPSGGPAGGDPAYLREQLLDRWGIEYAILNTNNLSPFSAEPNGYAGALCSALNDFTAAEWLSFDNRLYSSIALPADEPDAAVAEIRRLGANPRFVQAEIKARNDGLMGDRRYWPIYRAAVECGLPVAVHVGGLGGQPLTGAGWGSYYFEVHAGHTTSFQAHMISLVLSGVFEEIPDLRIIFIEGGLSWVPPLMWRLDRSHRLLRDEAPYLKEQPSHYIRKHFWFTTQPIEEPDHPVQFTELLEHLDMSTHLLFATDYPHWDFDAPDRALPTGIPKPLKAGIMAEFAREFYGLPGGKPA